MKVAINILNYNTFEKSKICIESCLCQKKCDFRIFLIDNQSTDDSFERLKALYGETISYLQNGDNYGYAKGNNLGVKYVYSKGYDYTLLLNSDTALSNENVLYSLIGIIQKYPKCAVVAPSILTTTGYEVELHINDSPYLNLLRYFNILPANKQISEELYEVSVAQGSALFFDNSIFIKVGGFPEHYFMYAEENNLAKKILWEGYLIVWYKNSVNYVNHIHDKSEKVDSWRVFLMGRNSALEYLEYRDIASIRWFIAFNLFVAYQRLKGNLMFVNGVEYAMKIYNRSVTKDFLLNDGRDTIFRIGK